MASARQKTILAGELGLFLLENGGLLTGNEYRALANGPLRWATMRRLFGNWNRTLLYLEQAQPEIWEDLQNVGEEVVSTEEALETLKSSEPNIDLSAIEEYDGTDSEE